MLASTATCTQGIGGGAHARRRSCECSTNASGQAQDVASSTWDVVMVCFSIGFLNSARWKALNPTKGW